MKPSIKTFPFIEIFLMLTFFLSCSEKKENLIKEQKFIDIYAHILILEELENDSLAILTTSAFLDSAGVTVEQVDSTLEYYSKNPEEWSEIMREIRDRIKELRNTPLDLDSLILN